MAVFENLTHIYEPTPLQCGQAVLAMLCKKTVDEIIDICRNERETTLKDMREVLLKNGIVMGSRRIEFKNTGELPKVAVLSLETPHCWHWSLFCNGKFYDPEYGLIDTIPPSNRRYYWEIS